MIDKHSPVPIYYQIEEYIKDIIKKNDLNPGDLIPSERELTEIFQVSRMTVRQAINELVNDGCLYRKKGRGTFVSSPKIEQPLQGLTSFSEDMKKRGMIPGTRLLSFSFLEAKTDIALHLEINEGDAAYEIKRIRLADEQPMAFETTFIPVNLVQGLTREIAQGSIYDYIENTLNYRIERGTQIIEAGVASDEEAHALQITEGDPTLFIHRTTYLENGRPFEWVKSVYRADRYKFVTNMSRN